jgi:pimeloyl-ACP methyl ester carboxylesterase
MFQPMIGRSEAVNGSGIALALAARYLDGVRRIALAGTVLEVPAEAVGAGRRMQAKVEA